MPLKIISVVGARPNFMKIAPFIRAINEHNIKSGLPDMAGTSNKQQATSISHLLVHTGQHYDDQMSRRFFQDLNIPEADINLGVGSGSHAEQVGHTMIAFEKVLREHKPDWVVVVGDVNATLACSVTAKKEWVKVCHIEAGLRSGDIKMPEEVNRLVTDRLSDLLLTPDELSAENLRKEGVPEERIRFTGNIMIDTLEANRAKAEKLDIRQIIQNNLYHPGSHSPGLTVPSATSGYALLTLHRPSNVDDEAVLKSIVDFLCNQVVADMPLLWAMHPRTQKQLELFGLWDQISNTSNLILLQPLGYHEMLRLNMTATIMLTDSGGLQEECTVLGTPCLTLRWNTERPVTLQEHGGASILVGNNINCIREEYLKALVSPRKPFRPALWDGHTAERCLQAIIDYAPDNENTL
jgi:UDP-N-acetylglucosamine 2-epimerase (non-hydrolysing)